jgi:hypothetical protein
MAKPPNPLDPGHIDGQNPATPERLPGATPIVEGKATGAGNEEELGGRPAFLFKSGTLYGVSLDSSGANLPAQSIAWALDRYITLGVRDVGLPNITPEPVIRGIVARGYHIWDGANRTPTFGTGQ